MWYKTKREFIWKRDLVDMEEEIVTCVHFPNFK